MHKASIPHDALVFVGDGTRCGAHCAGVPRRCDSGWKRHSPHADARGASGASADLIDVLQQVSGILVHTNGAGALELVLAVASRQQADTEGACAPGS